MVYKKTGVLFKLSEDKSVDVLSESFSRENRKKTAKNEMPLVSVITVVFNREKEIEKTIKSVISQSYENIEYIIIDGNSTDNTLSVIKKYSNRINYYASANDQGIYQAMNRGIKLAQGDYISLINAGDCMDSNFVELSINLLIKHKTENILSYCKLVGEECPSSFNSGLLTYHMNINHQTFLVSKHVYNSVGLYSEDFQVASDIKWTRDAFLYGVKAVFVNQELIAFEKGGLSDGKNSDIRKTIVKENILDYKLRFPFLTDEESESLYNFRFNKYIIHSILDLIVRHKNRSFLFVESIKYYFKYCLMHRNNFSIDFYEIDALFPVFVNLIKELDLSYNLINLDVDGNNKFPYYIKQVENIRNTSKDKKNIIHYVEVFNRASETFIYDVVNRLHRHKNYNSIVICDVRDMENERYFEYVFCIKWSQTHPLVRDFLYQLLLKETDPFQAITHFLINGVKFAKRIGHYNDKINFLHMMHGIDVFLLREKNFKNGYYRDYALNYLQYKKNHHFSTPSKYLKAYAMSRGFEYEKISIIHNTIEKSFYENRKNRDYFYPERELKILSIGRLIDWKGHFYLLKALAMLFFKNSIRFKLSLVYGRHDELLQEYRKLCVDEGIADFVEFIDFIDFRTNQNFIPSFDLFVLPSTLSKDGLFKTETFGVATLEAIASGLPVITTNAGASKEIIGSNFTEFARIVDHGSIEAIYGALVEMLHSNSTFKDNKNFADKVLETYSENKQLVLFDELFEKKYEETISVAVFSSDVVAGAGGAAYRCHLSFLENGLNSKLICRQFGDLPWNSDNLQITALESENLNNFNELNYSTELRKKYTIFTIDEHHISNDKLYELVKHSDVVSLHWSTRFISCENIAFLSHLNIPVVLTLRDMNYLAGGCHYFHGCQQWKSGCDGCPQLPEGYYGVAKEVFDYKKRNWNFKNITLVVLSDISKSIAKNSALFCNSRIEKISNGFKKDYMKIHDRKKSRFNFKLPVDKFLLLYIPSYESKVKGSDEALDAFKILNEKKLIDLVVVTAGSAKLSSSDVGFDVINLGYLSDKYLMSKLYSSVDATLIPSLEETFSNTCAEALLCGCPVVGFKAGAIPEMVINGKTGILADGFTAKSLSNAIEDIYSMNFDREICRNWVLENFSSKQQSRLYENLFEELRESYYKRKHKKMSLEKAKGLIETRFNSTCLYTSLKLKGSKANRAYGNPLKLIKSVYSKFRMDSNVVLISSNNKVSLLIDNEKKLSMVQQPSQKLTLISSTSKKCYEWMIDSENQSICLYSNNGIEYEKIFIKELNKHIRSYFKLKGSLLLQFSIDNDKLLAEVILARYFKLVDVQ